MYAIRLGNGTLSEATVKINITGANDNASIAVVGLSDNAVIEAGGVANGTPGDPAAAMLEAWRRQRARQGLRAMRWAADVDSAEAAQAVNKLGAFPG